MKKVELTIEQAEFILDVVRRFERLIKVVSFMKPEWGGGIISNRPKPHG